MASNQQHRDEDDIDDLDDVLDQFSSKPSASAAQQQQAQRSTPASTAGGETKPAAAASAPAAATVTNEDEDGLPSGFDDVLSKQFAAELAKGMEDMFGPGAAGGPPATAGAAGDASKAAGTGDAEPEMSEEEMMKQFEKIMAEMGLGEASGQPSASGSASKGAGPSSQGPQQQAENFQDAIKSTMSRLKQSSSNASAGGSGGANPFGDFSEDDMAKLLSSLGGDGEMPEGEEGMAKMLEKMMGELMSKEVLYEPLKELRDKYPSYLAAPPPDVKPEDLARYKDQHRIVSRVIETFDDPKFDNGTDSEKQALKDKVSGLMNEMQEGGAPPPEVAGEMPEGLEGIPGLGGGSGPGNEEDCVVM